MNPEDSTQRTLEVVVSENVFSRLKTQMLLVYGVSFALATIIAWSLTWQYRALSDLASSRISEYQLLVADGLQESTISIKTKWRCAHGHSRHVSTLFPRTTPR